MRDLYPHILYFSKDSTSDDFEQWLKKYTFKNDYRKMPFPLFRFHHLNNDVNHWGQELRRFLADFEFRLLPSLVVVTDFRSFSDEKEDISRVLLELILEYPEVKFVFDEFNLGVKYFNLNNEKKNVGKQNIEKEILDGEEDNYLKFLGLNREIPIQKEKEKPPISISVLNPQLHCFESKKTEVDKKVEHEYKDLKLLLDGNNNLFDASNLRSTIKAFFFSNIEKCCLDTYANYYNTQISRAEHLAFSVEEEHSQCLFNAYALFACGYRVRVVNSATELTFTNETYDSKFKTNIVIRDYDLQFEDKIPSDGEIYQIRGYDRLKNVCTIDSENKYWSNLRNVKTVFVTQASEDSKKSGREDGIEFEDITSNKQTLYSNCQHGGFINQKGHICGLQKPINGIYDLPRYIEEVRAVANDSRHNETDFFIKDRKESQTRKEGGHAASPFIYHIAESLITRARKYYDNENFVVAAVLTREALEVLNGFHKSLMWEAVHLNAIAENALVMNQIGCNDDKLAVNLENRLHIIKQEVKRIGGENIEANRNVLLQIFSDIRSFCRKREHFKSADVALKWMVHEQHKVRICCKYNKLKNFWSCFKSFKMQEVWKYSIWRNLKHFFGPILLLGLLLAFTVMSNNAYTCDNTQNIIHILPYIPIVLFVLCFICKPMNFVYGLVTTRGNLTKFMMMLSLVIGLFWCIYYFGFFKDAGITRTMDSPLIAYKMFDKDTICKYKNTPGLIYEHNNTTLKITDEIILSHREAIEQHDHGLDSCNIRFYKKVSCLNVLSNTIETTLEQGATDFFNIAMFDYMPKHKNKRMLFRAVVLLHIFISWIFLGVFISMLYQKFRNE